MNRGQQYQLIDFGDGRKLERIGGVIVDRPSPAARGTRKSPEIWKEADARFEIQERHQGEWTLHGELPEPWLFEAGFGKLLLKLSPFGHLGVFTEQETIWNWLTKQSSRLNGLEVLNLFAYTGGTSLALAFHGATVTHVDSAANIVTRARQNAELSGLADRPIRWIVEDVLKFVRREIKRGKRYDGFVLDPPTYGHGVKKEIWRIEDDLPTLLELLGELCQNDCQLVALSCHSPGYETQRLEKMVRSTHLASGELVQNSLSLNTGDARSLPSGYFVGCIKQR